MKDITHLGEHAYLSHRNPTIELVYLHGPDTGTLAMENDTPDPDGLVYSVHVQGCTRQALLVMLDQMMGALNDLPSQGTIDEIRAAMGENLTDLDTL